jgi:phosphoenolpyruvate carboxylase
MRQLIGLETDPEDPSRKKTYLKAVNSLIEEVKPVNINFGSLVAERTTAKRLFMLVAQILKYVDQETPIRFLIAETESPFTLVAALYFAKLFGVEEKIDLSPLFETPRALSRGARIVDEMLSNPHFREYVRRRGRICVQTGFSDAGRHLGQTAAAFAIENFRRRLAKVLAKHRLAGIEVVIFNTHGESLGRGAHPESFQARLNYVMSPQSRKELAQTGAKVKEEFSFQGGDGYLYFLNPYLALAVVTRLLEETFHLPDQAEDPFYQEWDYVYEFFAVIRQFNERLMQDLDYAILLQDYGRHFLFPTGSRSVKRQFEEKRTVVTAGEIRAIPHNAILHQLGLLANTIGGVGEAIKRNPEKFRELKERSARFKLLVSLANYGFSLSDFYAFSGYLEILDPRFWLMLVAKPPCPERAPELRAVADHLEELSKHVNLAKVGRTFSRDYLDFSEASHLLRDSFEGLLDPELKDALEILHAIRLTIIYRIFTLAIQIPEFSPQRQTTREEILERIFHLDVEQAVFTLKNIFPLLESLSEIEDFGEEATYHTEQYLGYLREHREIFDPLLALYRLMQRISGGITHLIGSFG